MNGSLATIPIAPNALLHNKYEPIHLIGAGSFGEVWLATDHAVQQRYAIKILKPGVMVAGQLREAQIGHAFTHNNLVRVHQADVLTDGRVIIAMDYLPDGPVTKLANPANYLILPTAIRAIIDVLQGLEHLHASNFFHNDIKPENILIGPNGQAKLGDYGIVGISQDGQPVPPPAQYFLHVAPETAIGHGIESRTDIFQTGLTFFRLLTGLGVLRSKLNAIGGQAYAQALASGRLITDVDFPAFVPRSVARIIRKAIDPNPAVRFQSALEMRRALEKLSFRGYWTIEANGTFVGYDEKHRFRFQTTLAGALSSFEGFKLRLSSGRETRISAFTSRQLTASEAKRREIDFIRSVIAGQAA